MDTSTKGTQECGEDRTFLCQGCGAQFQKALSKGENAPKFCSSDCQHTHHDTSRAGRPSREVALAEDAKWERVFQRFVDPDYYAPRTPTVQSSFGAFAAQMEVLCRASL